MPEYLYRCKNKHECTVWFSIVEHESGINCLVCGERAPQVITAPMLVSSQPECRYDSPIDGSPITSWAARRNDLAKHGCREYDPGMKQDYHQRLKDSEAALDKAVDTHVEASISKMNTQQRGKLYSELTEQGTDAIVVRK